MGQAIGELLPAAVGVAISPLPIIAVVLMLMSARANALAFLGGWILGVAGAGAVLLLLAGGIGPQDDGQPAGWVGWLKLALGIGLLALAARQWRGRPHEGEEASTPRWMGALDSFTPAKAAAAGAALSALNPKNLLLIAAGMAAIAQIGITAGEQAAALVVFTLVAAVGVATPVVISVALGDRSAEVLERLRAWLSRHNAAIMAVLLLILGVKLVGDAISALS